MSAYHDMVIWWRDETEQQPTTKGNETMKSAKFESFLSACRSAGVSAPTYALLHFWDGLNMNARRRSNFQSFIVVFKNAESAI